MPAQLKVLTASVSALLVTVLGAAPVAAATAPTTSDDSETATSACVSRLGEPRTAVERQRLARCVAEEQGAARRSVLLRTSEAYRDKLRGDEWVFTSTH